MKKLKSQLGVAVLEIIILVGVLAIGAAVYYVGHQPKASNPPKLNVTKPSPAETKVRQFYSDYIKASSYDANQGGGKTTTANDVLKKDLTSTLADQLIAREQTLAYNPVVCGQNVPDTFSFKSSKISGNST